MTTLLFAEGTADWIAICVAIGVSVSGWYVTHRMVVRHDNRKTAIDLMRSIAEHSHLSWNCHINLNNLHWRIKDCEKDRSSGPESNWKSNDQLREMYRNQEEKLREELAGIQSKLHSDSVMVKLLFDDSDGKGLFDAIQSLIYVIREEGKFDAVQQAKHRYDDVTVECTNLFKKYDKENWNLEAFEQRLRETF